MKLTAQRLSFRKCPRMALVLLAASAFLLALGGCHSSAGPGGTSGGLADLMPGHQDAALRKRVEADSFPTADQALHGSPQGADVSTGSHGGDAY